MSSAAITPTKILHVKTPLYEAQATFQKDRGRWRCIKATPSIDWMPIVTLETIQEWLRRNDYQHRWSDPGAAPGPAAEPGGVIAGAGGSGERP
jgi:hypothetical protein